MLSAHVPKRSRIQFNTVAWNFKHIDPLFETEFLLNKEAVFTKFPWRCSCSCSHPKKLRMSIIYSETHNQPFGTFLLQNHNFKYFGGSYQTNYWKPIYLHFSNYQYRYETYWNYRWFEGIVCKNIDIEKKLQENDQKIIAIEKKITSWWPLISWITSGEKLNSSWTTTLFSQACLEAYNWQLPWNPSWMDP